MTKFKKKLTVIVSVFLIIGVLGSVAAIFAIQKYEPVAPDVITSDVGYILGTERGTGKYMTLYGYTMTPSEENTRYDGTSRVVCNWNGKLNTANPSNSIVYNDYVKYEDGVDTTKNNTWKFTTDENGDTYMSLTSKSSGFNGPDVLLSLPTYCNRGYSDRARTYLVEFDFMLDEYNSLNSLPLLEIAFNSVITQGSSNSYEYTNTAVYASQEPGFYCFRQLKAENNSLLHKNLKFGEWYNLRFEITLDNDTTKSTFTLYVNDEVYYSVSSLPYVGDAMKSCPTNLTISTYHSRNSLTYHIDNVSYTHPQK